MSVLKFANLARGELASSIGPSATSLSVGSGQGSLFPTLGAGEYFVATLIGAASPTTKEIIWVTARSGDTMTVLRAQEGTSALSWTAGDILANLVTAGSMATLLQSGQFQQQTANYAADTGTANSLVFSLDPNPGTLAGLIGAPVRVLVENNNTGASTASVNGLTATAIKNPNGTALSADQLIAGGIAEMIYDGTVFQLLSTTGPAGVYAPINSPAFTGTPTAPTPSTSDNSTKIATTAFVKANVSGGLSNPSPALTGTPTAPTAGSGVSSTQIATTAFANPGNSKVTNGYHKLPGGTIIQWGTSTGFADAYDPNTVTFPLAFPNACLNVVAVVQVSNNGTIHNQVVAQVGTISSTQVILTLANTGSDHNYPVNIMWFAVGH